MDIGWSLILGAVQGLTEFLPVSSSGHLVLIQNLTPGYTSPGIILEVILHAGTTLAVLVYFRKTIIKLTRKYLLFIAIATIPAAIAGTVFRDFWISLFDNTKLVGGALIFSAVINFMTNKLKRFDNTLDTKSSFFTGVAQVIAITPGISRSGLTIFASVYQGVSPKEAAQFSFLLSIPVIVGANLLELQQNAVATYPNLLHLISGFLTAFIFGLIAIKIVLQFLERKKFHYFAIYCFVVGIIFLLY